MADRFTKIKAKQFKNYDLRPEDLKAVNTANDKSFLTYNASTSFFKWEDFPIYTVEDDSLESTTSLDYVVKLSIETTIPVTGKYLLFCSIEGAVLSYFYWEEFGIGKIIVARETDLGYDIYNVHNIKQDKLEIINSMKVLDLEEGEYVKFILAYSSGDFISVTYVQRARMMLRRIQ